MALHQIGYSCLSQAYKQYTHTQKKKKKKKMSMFIGQMVRFCYCTYVMLFTYLAKSILYV